MHRRVLVALLGLVLAAAAVRIWALDFCLPSSMCRPDERTHGLIAMSIAGGDLNPHFFNYPSLYFYGLGLLDRVLLLFGVEAGDLSPLLLAGRAAGVAAGCLTVLATFFLGRRLGSARTGLVAASLLALSYLHVRDSHFMATDVPAGLLATLALVLILRALDAGSARAFALAGAVAGLAASIKYNVGAVAVSLVAACGLRRRVWLALGAMVCAFVLTSPFVLLDLSTFIEQFGWELRHFRGGLYPGERETGTVVYYATRILPHGFGLLPLLLAAAGCVAWLKRRDRPGLVVLAGLAAYAVAVGSGTTVFARYLVPVLPALCTAAAVGLLWVSDAVPRFRVPVLVGLLLAALVQPVWNIVAFDRLLARQDTRAQAAAWIDEHLAPGALLQVGGIGVHHWVLDPVQLPRFRLLSQDDSTQQRILDRPLSELSDHGLRYVLTHEHPLVYSTLQPGVAERLRSGARQLACFDPLAPGAVVQPLYDYEDAFYMPFARFGGVLRPGPRICIYEL